LTPLLFVLYRDLDTNGLEPSGFIEPEESKKQAAFLPGKMGQAMELV